MAAANRDTAFVVRISRPELAWFHRVAQAQGLTLSELMRQSVAMEGARLGVAPVPATTA